MAGYMSASAQLDVTVIRRVDLPGDIMAIELAASDGATLPAFAAGAHIDVRVDAATTRQYSLCGNPTDTGSYRIAILKDAASRGGSVALHERLGSGEHLRIGLPRNHFPLAMEADHSVLIGGGVGVTPLIAMAWALYAAGRDFQLFYCVMTQDRAAFADILANAPFADRVATRLSHAVPATPFDPAHDLPPSSPGVHIYCCGPTGFMDWVLESAAAAGYDTNQLHREDFGAEVDLSGSSFHVEAKRSGKQVVVRDGETIAAALAAVGITVELSCEEGVCGTCLTDVLAGDIDHRDHYLTDEEKAEGSLILVCCSRARSDILVLDL